MPKQAVLVVTDDQAFHDLLLRLVDDGKLSCSDFPEILHSIVASPLRDFTKSETVRNGSSSGEQHWLLHRLSTTLAIEALQAASTAYRRVTPRHDGFHRDVNASVSAGPPRDGPMRA